MTLLRVHSRAADGSVATRHLTLPFDLRQKSRLRASLDEGGEVAVVLDRGSALADGVLLLAEDGSVVAVQAAPEPVSVVHSADPVLLLRAAYHLGNRHIPLQVADGRVAYLADHVLDAMVVALGLSVVHETRPFEPEQGAYGTGHSFLSHGHSHAGPKLRRPTPHSHGHAHDHDHDHDHDLPPSGD